MQTFLRYKIKWTPIHVRWPLTNFLDAKLNGFTVLYEKKLSGGYIF